MKYQLRHTTHYEYSSPVTLSHNEARLLPRDLDFQQCKNTRLSISPTPLRQHERHDFFGNRLVYFAIQDIHDSLEVTVRSLVTTQKRSDPSGDDVHVAWEAVVDKLAPNGGTSAVPIEPDILDARLFTLNSPFIHRSEALRVFALDCFSPHRSLCDSVLALNQRIYREFSYDPEYSTLATPLDDVLSDRKGVCQDFAHLAIGALRSVGLAARYVSGYLETLPPPGQEKRVGADASHAWLSVFIPNWGWLDIDPTNGSLPSEQYLTLAWGRDYGDVTPLRGVMNGGGAHELTVEVDVIPLAQQSTES
ncbi:transglutaminase family protein [Saccharospirillum impatiens]|uniref:transglutaminase family protein n=1 Tax=Saccharospirillum impatiens TaxID=169438 RepID=UPI000417985E|nr:transglutaminase family protein [Saccharospirillum impatiens]